MEERSTIRTTLSPAHTEEPVAVSEEPRAAVRRVTADRPFKSPLGVSRADDARRREPRDRRALRPDATSSSTSPPERLDAGWLPDSGPLFAAREAVGAWASGADQRVVNQDELRVLAGRHKVPVVDVYGTMSAVFPDAYDALTSITEARAELGRE